MKRRAFIKLLGGAAWPLAARAQQPAVPIIGYLYLGSETTPSLLAAFQKGLGETGHLEGHNVAVEYRWVKYSLNMLSDMAADLELWRVDVFAHTVSL